MLLDLALRQLGIDPDRVNGYASTELTHSAIAAFVASGMADVGFGVEPAAHHFGLDFIPIVDEDYYFACDRAHLERTPLATVIDLLRGSAFRTASSISKATIQATAASWSISRPASARRVEAVLKRWRKTTVNITLPASLRIAAVSDNL